MQRTEHPLLSQSLGSQKTLVAFQFGDPLARPKVYVQASLHAGELPGMLVAHHLRGILEQADAEGRMTGQVVLVPAANPIGLAQRIDHHVQGRFEFGTSENFNRHYPDLAQAIGADVLGRLGEDPASNVALVRSAMQQWLEQWSPANELDSLRRRLLLLAHDADLVLDLHCDGESVMHLYCEEPCWPAMKPLAQLLQCQAVLLARDSGGGPFDERLSGIWWQLAERVEATGRMAPLPQACASTTVELRGEGDVLHTLARPDAQAIAQYLVHAGVMRAEAQPLPALRCEPTPLAGSQTLRSELPGVLVYRVQPGQRVHAGEVVAEVIDPTAPGASHVHEVKSAVDGVLYAIVRDRYLQAGGEVGKVAGAKAFRTGDLLGA